MAITHHKVTGMLTLFIADQITDEDHQLDEVNLMGTVTWKPVFPKGMSQAKASEPARLVSLKPIKSLVADGQIVSLSGTVSEIGDVPGGPGQELPVMIDDTPVWWECVFDVTYADTPVRIPSMLVDATEGDVDITTLVSAGGFPEVPMDDVESVIATVRSMSRAAEDAIRRAEEAASAVGQVSDEAKVAVKAAGESAAAASESAKVAKSGADRVGSAEAVIEAKEAAAESARKADERAGDAEQAAKDAEQSASRASGSAGDAAASAGDAGARAGEADASANAAAASQKAAADSASAAAADRVQVGKDAEAAQTSAEYSSQHRNLAEKSAAAAKTSESNAASSASSAAADAARAEAAADASDGAAVRAVIEKVDELTRDAPEKFDTLKEIADALEAQEDMGAVLTSQIAGKANASHTHAVADVTGLQTALDGKVAATSTGNRVYVTDSSGNQTALAWQSGTAAADSVAVRGAGGRLLVGEPTASGNAATKNYVDTAVSSKAAVTAMNARPALFSGAGAAPSTITGAVVGDWWLNTTTMELSKITGV